MLSSFEFHLLAPVQEGPLYKKLKISSLQQDNINK